VLVMEEILYIDNMSGILITVGRSRLSAKRRWGGGLSAHSQENHPHSRRLILAVLEKTNKEWWSVCVVYMWTI